jgi:hypothetical protein
MKKFFLLFLMFAAYLTANAQGEYYYLDCFGSFDDGSGVNNYAPNINNRYVIYGPDITIAFSKFELGSPGDLVSIYKFGDELIGTYSILNPPSGVISVSTSELYIVFRTDAVTGSNEKGWIVQYKVLCAYDSLKNKLLAYFPFDRNACDVSGNFKNGNISNAEQATDRQGNANSAYYFNGSNSLIYLPKPIITDNTKFALSFWFNTKGNKPTSDIYNGQALVDFRGNFNFCVSYYEIDNAAYQKAVVFNVANPSANISCLTPNNYIQDNTWYHVVASYANNTMNLYINGTLVDTKTQTPPNAVYGYYNAIGKDYKTWENRLWFYGSIDQVAIFKEGLTQAEVEMLYYWGITETSIPGLHGPLWYSYDKNGNRTGRNTIKLKAGSFVASARDSALAADAMNGQITDPEIYQGAAGESFVKIYPNPTRGELKVEITDFDFAQKSAIYVYNTAGHLVAQKSPATDMNIINLLHQPNGMYIMKILLGDKTSEWKVIKE